MPCGGKCAAGSCERLGRRRLNGGRATRKPHRLPCAVGRVISGLGRAAEPGAAGPRCFSRAIAV